MNRRQFLASAATVPLLTNSSCRHRPAVAASPRLFFTSDGRTAMVRADGSGLRYFDFNVPGQATWQPGPFLSDGKRVIFLSMEPRRDGPGRPFEEYYTRTPTHLCSTSVVLTNCPPCNKPVYITGLRFARAA